MPQQIPTTDSAPDDIPEGALPMQTIADLAQQRLAQPAVDPSTPAGQVLMSVDQALYTMSQHAATVLAGVDKSWDAALRVMTQHQQPPCVPFSATVSAVTPAGFPITLTCQNSSQEAFLAQMGALMAFLQENQFTAGVPF